MAKKRKNKFINKTNIFLLILFLTAFLIRIYGLSSNLFFGPEQGIDFLRMKEIAILHEPVLVGAKTDIAGVLHGPIYYYVGAIPFLMSGGDPLFIAYFLIALNCLSVFIIYILGKKLFNKRVGIFSALFFTFSFGAISYSRWLSSHPFTIPLSLIFFLGLLLYLQGKNRWLYVATISFALLGQSEFLNYLFFGGMFIGVIIIYYKKFLNESKFFLLKNIILFVLFGLLHYVIFDIKNQFIMSKSLLNLAHGSGYYVSIQEVIRQMYESLSESIAESILPFYSLPAIFIIIASLITLARSKYTIQKRLFLLWIILPLVFLILLRHSVLQQFFVYIVTPSLVLTSYLIDYLLSRKIFFGIALFLIVFLAQSYAIVTKIPSDGHMFYQSTQPDLKYSDEIKVIDEIYKRENGKDFSFQSYTIPYWVQQAWEYLFWEYGLKKYGYEPVTVNGKTLYVIVQNDPSSKAFQDDWLKNTVSKWGTEKDTFRYGEFNVKVLSVP